MLRSNLRVAAMAVLALGIVGRIMAAEPPASDKKPANELRLKAQREKLAKSVTLDGFDPNTSFKDVAEEFQKQFGLKLIYDHKTLDESPVGLPKMVEVRVSRVLELLLTQLGGEESTYHYRLRPDGIELTTDRGEQIIRGARGKNGAPPDHFVQMTADMRNRLANPIDLDGFEANTPLKEAMGFLSERYGITILFDTKSFVNDLQIMEPENQPIKLDQLRAVPLASVLNQLMDPTHGRIRLRGGCGVDLIAASELERRLAVSPDGKLIATASRAGQGELIRIWERSSGRSVRQFRFTEETLTAFVFTPDSKSLAVLGRDRKAEAKKYYLASWDAATGKKLGSHELDGQERVALAADGQTVALANDTDWHLRNLQTKKKVHQAISSAGIAALGFSTDGETVLGLDRGFQFTSVLLWRPGSSSPLTRYRLDQPHGGNGLPVSSVALSHDGRLLAAVDCLGRVTLWEMASGRRVLELKNLSIIHQLAFSSDDRLLAGIGEVGWKHAVEVWETDTGKDRARLQGDYEGGLLSLAFESDGKSVAAATEDGTPIIWDVADIVSTEPAEAIKPAQLETLWKQLAGSDAIQAHRAIHALSASPDSSLPFLRERLKPFTSVSQEQREKALAQALAELESDEFEKREAAQSALLLLGKSIEPQLRQELTKPKPSLEARRRIERVLERFQEPVASPEVLRELRAVRALERAGVPEAVALLKRLANGGAEGEQTQVARAALARLEQRKGSK